MPGKRSSVKNEKQYEGLKKKGRSKERSARKHQRAERRVAVRSFPRRPLVEPVSTVERGFFRGAGFYVRVGVLSVVALTMFGILVLRLWSLEVIQGSRFAHVAQAQTFRT